MEEDLIQVYRLGEAPIVVPRSQIVWTDRSRMACPCPRKRFLESEYAGTGYITTARNEDLTIGGAVHEGVDLLLQGGSLDKALTVAEECYVGAHPWGDWLLPEQKEVLNGDGLHLVKALIYAFHSCYLQRYLEQYEVLDVEEEINWLLHHDKRVDRYYVFMSRPDAVLRDRKTGRIWHVSHKTAKKFDDVVMARLEVDLQRFAEGLAVEAKYGEPIEGTYYNYFIKGDRRRDEATGCDRYTTGLIRPYIFRQSGGDLTPEMVSFAWEWNHLEIATGKVSKKRLGKGWEKADIHREMDFMTYLGWLEQKWVQREGNDYLLDSIAGMIPVFWEEEHARRWMWGAAMDERTWFYKMVIVGEKPNLDHETVVEKIPLASSHCFSYNHRCAYFDVCWRGRHPDTLLNEGSLSIREPNHLQEFYSEL
jgi:hypothetical protein